MPEGFHPKDISELAHQTAIHEALMTGAKASADEAQAVAPVKTGAYAASIGVTNDGDGVRLVATDWKANWIEFGTGAPSPTPAFAPLRRGCEAAGLKFVPRKR